MVDISFLNLVNQLFLATYLINPYTIKPIKKAWRCLYLLKTHGSNNIKQSYPVN